MLLFAMLVDAFHAALEDRIETFDSVGVVYMLHRAVAGVFLADGGGSRAAFPYAEIGRGACVRGQLKTPSAGDNDPWVEESTR